MKNLALITVYKFLRFFTTKTFDFILTLTMFIGISLLFNNLTFSIFMLVLHLVFFKYLNPIIRKNCKTDLSYEEYTKDIESISNKK